MARPIASMARPFEVERLSRKPSPASRSASTAWSICSAGSGGSQVPKARMRCGEFDSASCEISSEVSPLIWGRLSPAAQAIRICGSANSSARSRSAWTCRSAMSARSRSSVRVARTRVRISRIAATHGKADQRQRRRQHREFLVIEVEPGRNRLRERSNRRHSAGSGDAIRAVASAIRPWRASEVHDSRVRRIAATTPDIICPRTHDCRPGVYPAVHRSSREYPHRESAGRVQTVNANLAVKNAADYRRANLS